MAELGETLGQVQVPLPVLYVKSYTIREYLIVFKERWAYPVVPSLCRQFGQLTPSDKVTNASKGRSAREKKLHVHSRSYIDYKDHTKVTASHEVDGHILPSLKNRGKKISSYIRGMGPGC